MIFYRGSDLKFIVFTKKENKTINRIIIMKIIDMIYSSHKATADDVVVEHKIRIVTSSTIHHLDRCIIGCIDMR